MSRETYFYRSVVVPPGDPTIVVPAADLRITNVALGHEVEDEASRITVKLVYHTPGAKSDDDDSDYEDDTKPLDPNDVEPFTTAVLCHLTYGKVRHKICLRYFY